MLIETGIMSAAIALPLLAWRRPFTSQIVWTPDPYDGESTVASEVIAA